MPPEMSDVDTGALWYHANPMLAHVSPRYWFAGSTAPLADGEVE